MLHVACRCAFVFLDNYSAIQSVEQSFFLNVLFIYRFLFEKKRTKKGSQDIISRTNIERIRYVNNATKERKKNDKNLHQQQQQR